MIRKTITPEVAAEMLAHNYEGNRNIRKAYAAQLADVMREGRFKSINGQTIVVGTDGTLYDGQHRLSAIVESGATLDFDVFVTDDPDVYKTIDNGTKRRISDFINAANATNSAAIASVITCIANGTLPIASCLQGKVQGNKNVDRVAVIDYAETHADELRQITSSAMGMRAAVGGGPIASYGAFLYAVRFCNRDVLLDEFVADFCSQVPTNVTVASARTTLQRAYVKKRSTPTRPWVVGVLLDAYEHYTKMDNATKLTNASRRVDTYSKYIDAARIMRNGGAS